MGKAELKLEIDADLLKQAEDAHLPISQVLEQALEARLHPEGVEERARRWADENADAIRAYGERIEREGVFGEDWRTW
jgi:antitoxin CcdA